MYNILFAVNSRMAFVWYYRYIKTKKKNAFLFLLKTTAVTLTNRKKRKKKKIVGRTDYYTDTITGRKIPEKKKKFPKYRMYYYRAYTPTAVCSVTEMARVYPEDERTFSSNATAVGRAPGGISIPRRQIFARVPS